MSGQKAEHKIYTENENFNSRFSVYASDEHNAYYILTPQRIEKIMSFADTVNGQVSLVFCDENLFIAVRNESMFDANINEPVANQTAKITKDAKFIQKAKEILIEQQPFLLMSIYLRFLFVSSFLIYFYLIFSKNNKTLEFILSFINP